MSEDSLPLRQWPAGIQQASVPANENALRVQALLSRALSVENDAPGTEYNGAVYIVGDTPAGAFAAFSEHDIALFEYGSWYAWSPVIGTSMVVGTSRMMFDGTEWVADPAGGGGGSGDVTGPATSAAGNFAVFADATGKEIEDGGTPGEMAFVDDAPSDSQEYVRKNGGWVVSTGGGGGGGLTNWTEGVNTSAPNATIPVVSLTVTNGATNVDVALAAKGSGATTAQVADNATSGGDKRGVYATDWQKRRSNANQVASGGYSAIGGGERNTASGQHSSVGGGYQNTASGAYSVAAGGDRNTASGLASVCGGGQQNSCANPYTFIGSGVSNTASANYAAIGGGQSNEAGGTNSFIGGGRNNTASGTHTWIPGGQRATTRGINGTGAYASGRFSIDGDAQVMRAVLRVATSSETPDVLTTSAGSASNNNQLVLPNNSAYAVKATVVVREAATGDTASWDVTACIKRGANAAATSLVGTPSVTAIGADAGAASWVLAVAADTTNGALQFQVTGEASHTLRWVADVYSCVQVVG